MKLQPGTEVTPNVRLEREIATGAMGSVWLAEHLTLNTKVAVKFISDRLDPDDPEVLERFVREASTAAQIKSSHVVQTFDQGVMRDGVPYIVMEYLEGEGLGERLQSGGAIPLPHVYRIVLQTAKALQSAHKHGIVHRDIKPDNIFLSTHDDELHVKVFDFGIAKHRRETPRPLVTGKGNDHQPELGLTNDGVMIGTPEYMSPEQVMSASSVDHHADLWGLTVVAYVCLTGRLPFTGADVGELCVNLLEATFEPPSKHRPDLPPALDAFFARALARDPVDRFQSARELASGLGQALPVESFAGELHGDGSPPMRVSAPSLEPDEPYRRGVRAATFSGTEADAVGTRRLSSSAIGILAVAVVLVGGALLVVFGGSGPESTKTDDRDVGAPAASSSAPMQAAPPPRTNTPAAVTSVSPSSVTSARPPPAPPRALPVQPPPRVRPAPPPPVAAPKRKEPGF